MQAVHEDVPHDLLQHRCGLVYSALTLLRSTEVVLQTCGDTRTPAVRFSRACQYKQKLASVEGRPCHHPRARRTMMERVDQTSTRLTHPSTPGRRVARTKTIETVCL